MPPQMTMVAPGTMLVRVPVALVLISVALSTVSNFGATPTRGDHGGSGGLRATASSFPAPYIPAVSLYSQPRESTSAARESTSEGRPSTGGGGGSSHTLPPRTPGPGPTTTALVPAPLPTLLAASRRRGPSAPNKIQEKRGCEGPELRPFACIFLASAAPSAVLGDGKQFCAAYTVEQQMGRGSVFNGVRVIVYCHCGWGWGGVITGAFTCTRWCSFSSTSM